MQNYRVPSAETVEGVDLELERVDYIYDRHSLAPACSG